MKLEARLSVSMLEAGSPMLDKDFKIKLSLRRGLRHAKTEEAISV